MCFLSSLTKLAHMLDLGHMAKLNVDTLSKKNYKKKTKGAANEQLISMKRFFPEQVSSIRILLKAIMSF